MTTYYRLTQIVGDGALTGPRWLLHLIKVMQHVAPAFALWCITLDPILSALVAGPGVYGIIIGRKLWIAHSEDKKLWPFIVDHLADWTNDWALACVALGGALIAARHLILGSTTLALCFLLWYFLHPSAVP